MNEVQTFLLEGRGVRGALVRLQETWQQVIAQHIYPAELKRLLGEGVAATVLLASGLKYKPQVSLQLQGDGPVRLLLVQCTEDLRVRGMAHCGEYTAGQSLLGAGRLVVHLDTGARHGSFQGVVPLTSARLGICLEDYFRRSEQLATRLILKSTERNAAGLLLQALPGKEPQSEDFERAAELAQEVDGDDLLAAPATELLPRLFASYDIRLFEPRPVLHDCRCTPDRIAGIVRMLGANEVEQLLADRGCVELTCEFCNRTFRYDERDATAILRGETRSTRLH
ncbi:MAG TPA: Hsp33 family molecular chaperone HslO [Gammaproteobacteria bacterium]